jgi:hypothetical protein|tara:strand:+ start:1156 stop:2199 length:1044 start_codon:yes stop_codon:yes gene_type:complete
MAISATSVSPKDFQLGIIKEATAGTAVVSSMNLINIDSLELPALNPLQVTDVRHGTGRTLKQVDTFASNKVTVKEISFSGIADSTILPILLENITQDSSGVGSSGDDLYEVLNNYEPSAIDIGTTTDSDNSMTFTVAVDNAVNSSYSMVFKGCVLTSLTINGDIGEESGRVKMSGTFKTGMVPDLSPSSAPTFGSTAHFNNNYFVTDFDTTKVAGVADCVLKSFSLTLENDAQFMGFDSSGNYQVIQRALPEVIATCDSVVKYDGNTQALIESFEGQSFGDDTGHVDIDLQMSSGTNKIGIDIDHTLMTDVSFSEEEAMFLSISQKAIADATATNKFFSIKATNTTA